MEKKLIAEKIYDALKQAAQGRAEIHMRCGESSAAVATNMPVGLVRQWLDVLEGVGWISRDGISIRLVKDYGYRKLGELEHFEEIREGQRVPMKELRKETRKFLKDVAHAERARGKKVRKK